MDNKPMDSEELAKWFGVSTTTVHRWVADGMPCLKPSRGVLRFDIEAVRAWCAVNADTEAGK